MSGSLGKTAKVARKAPPNLAESTQIQSPVGAGPLPLRLAKKKSLKNLNVVDQGQRKDLTSLVRRQAANTSLSHDQGPHLPAGASAEVHCLPLICVLLLKFHELTGLSHYRGNVVGELSTPNPLTLPIL